MSFILDALRKSDARRQQSGAPGLNSPEPPRPSRRRRRRWPWLAMAALLVVVVAATAYFVAPPGWLPGSEQNRQAQAPDVDAASGNRRSAGEEAAPAEAESPASVDTESLAQVEQPPAGEAAAAAGEEIQAERARERRRRRTPPDENTGVVGEPRQRESAPVPADEATEELERRLAEESRRRHEPSEETSEPARARRRVERAEPEAAAATRDVEARREPKPEPQAVQEAEPEPLNENVAEYLRAWELPLSVRRSLPELKLTIHVFSPNEPERFVLINGERRVAGDEIEGARIVEINREGAVVDFRSHRFLLEPR